MNAGFHPNKASNAVLQCFTRETQLVLSQPKGRPWENVKGIFTSKNFFLKE